MIVKNILETEQCKDLDSSVVKKSQSVRVFKYKHEKHDWQLSIGTLAEPKSNQLSLGGFRIAPENRVNEENYSNDREALQLAVSMDKKVSWSRTLKVAGHLAIARLNQMVGGKCVLLPSVNARVGQANDEELLNFALECLENFESTSGIHVVTGQDLGHGLLFSGKQASLEYMSQRFHGFSIANTSKPTAEGNFYALLGALKAHDIDIANAKVHLIGCGNIGRHILDKLLAKGADVVVLEARESVRNELLRMGVKAMLPEDKATFLATPMDALVVNGNGGSLDAMSMDVLKENQSLKIVCGSENLMMQNVDDAKVLQQNKKIFYPSEYCGMTGYLTAVEEYLSRIEGVDFSLDSMYPVAQRIEQSAYEATQSILGNNYNFSFEEAVIKIYC